MNLDERPNQLHVVREEDDALVIGQGLGHTDPQEATGCADSLSKSKGKFAKIRGT